MGVDSGANFIQNWMILLIFLYIERKWSNSIQIWMVLVFQYWNIFHAIQIWMFLVIHYWNECICWHPNLDVSSLPILEHISHNPNLDVSSLQLLI